MFHGDRAISSVGWGRGTEEQLPSCECSLIVVDGGKCLVPIYITDGICYPGMYIVVAVVIQLWTSCRPVRLGSSTLEAISFAVEMQTWSLGRGCGRGRDLVVGGLVEVRCSVHVHVSCSHIRSRPR